MATMTRTMCRALGVCLAAWPLVGCGDPDDETGGSEDTTAAETTAEPTTTTPTTSETSEETTSDETTTGGGGSCSPKEQDCNEGEKCTAYGKMPGDAWNANKCVPETGDGVAGDSCSIEGSDMFTGIDNCAKGFICQNVDMNNENGFCVEFCSPDNACPNSGPGGMCAPDTNEGFLPICNLLCDPLQQDCPGDLACYGDPSIDYFFCYGADPQGNDGKDHDPCAFTNACVAGLHCSYPPTTVSGCPEDAYGCCTLFCEIGGEAVCADPEECVAFFSAPTPGYENLGLCVLP